MRLLNLIKEVAWPGNWVMFFLSLEDGSQLLEAAGTARARS